MTITPDNEVIRQTFAARQVCSVNVLLMSLDQLVPAQEHSTFIDTRVQAEAYGDDECPGWTIGTARLYERPAYEARTVVMTTDKKLWIGTLVTQHDRMNGRLLRPETGPLDIASLHHDLTQGAPVRVGEDSPYGPEVFAMSELGRVLDWPEHIQMRLHHVLPKPDMYHRSVHR
jgi:hypothetical protein